MIKIKKHIKNLKGMFEGIRCIKHATGMSLPIIALSFILSGCINDKFDEPETPTEPKSDFYISLSVSLPSESTTKSPTVNTEDKVGGSSEEPLEGYGTENQINQAYMFFFDADRGDALCTFIATRVTTSGDDYVVAAKMEDRNLLALAGKKANLYVVVNSEGYMPATSFKTESEFHDSKFAVTENSKFFGSFYNGNEGGQYCPMANYDKYTLDLTGVTGNDDETKIKLMKDLFTGTYRNGEDKGKLWDMSYGTTANYTGAGVLKLERCVARVDYKDGSGSSTPHVYQLEGAKGPSGKDVYLKIVSLQLFNISQNSFILRHTKAISTVEGGEVSTPTDPIVFGFEKGTEVGKYNWIYDTDWDDKNKMTPSGDILETAGYFFNQPTINGNGQWEVSNASAGYNPLEELDSWLEDNRDWVNNSNNGYTPWYYIPENTLPSTDKMTLPFSTGVAFKMQLWDAQQDEKISRNLGSTFRITMEDNSYQEVEWEGDEENGGYYLTYRYLIEHNKESVNGNTGTQTQMAPMQIGIVRNNIYQLSVTGIKNLPDPHEPDNFNLTVNVNILPWTKRKVTVKW